jgi:hypothetical protein
LSGVLYDFTFLLDGDSVTLPIVLDELISLGWDLRVDLSDTLSGNTASAITLVRNYKRITAGIVNTSNEAIPIHESLVDSFTSYYYEDDDDYAVIELPRGIAVGVSTKNDVLRAFGGPTTVVDFDDSVVRLVYENEALGGGFRSYIMIYVDGEQGNRITEINISHRP